MIEPVYLVDGELRNELFLIEAIARGRVTIRRSQWQRIGGGGFNTCATLSEDKKQYDYIDYDGSRHWTEKPESLEQLKVISFYGGKP